MVNFLSYKLFRLENLSKKPEKRYLAKGPFLSALVQNTSADSASYHSERLCFNVSEYKSAAGVGLWASAKFPSVASTAALPQTAPPFRSAAFDSLSLRMSITWKDVSAPGIYPRSARMERLRLIPIRKRHPSQPNRR